MSIMLLVTRTLSSVYVCVPNARESLYSCTAAAILFSVARIGEMAQGYILKATTRYSIAAAHGDDRRVGTDRRVSTGVR